MPDAVHIFDRRRVRLHRDRASTHIGKSDFLIREMADRLADRLVDIKRTFPFALDLGAHTGILAEYITGKGGIKTLVQSDLSYSLLCHSRAGGNPVKRHGRDIDTSAPQTRRLDSRLRGNDKVQLVADEEFLPFAPNSFDLVMSAGSLHWVNDLPGTLIQINRILKPDGLFLAILPGGETLKELRQSFEQAEMSATGGISPRISPFVDVRDAGGLLQRAGFAEPVADSEKLIVSYAHPLKLLHDLRHMGETSAMRESRKGFLPCSLLMLTADHYLRRFSDAHGRVPATFELVTLTGWKSQPKIV